MGANFRWFCETADKKAAEELLNLEAHDGAFLIRYSTSDKNVFVLSLRYVDFFCSHFQYLKIYSNSAHKFLMVVSKLVPVS